MKNEKSVGGYKNVQLYCICFVCLHLTMYVLTELMATKIMSRFLRHVHLKYSFDVCLILIRTLEHSAPRTVYFPGPMRSSRAHPVQAYHLLFLLFSESPIQCRNVRVLAHSKSFFLSSFIDDFKHHLRWMISSIIFFSYVG